MYCKKPLVRLQFKLGEFDVDLSKEWEEWDYAQTIKESLWY